MAHTGEVFVDGGRRQALAVASQLTTSVDELASCCCAVFHPGAPKIGGDGFEVVAVGPFDRVGSGVFNQQAVPE